jgi:predicted histidine transporter YuiF (NhaC family)
MMTEHQLLGIMMVIQGLLLIVGLMIALQIYREARDSAQKSREVEQLVSASLEVAREILRQVKR